MSHFRTLPGAEPRTAPGRTRAIRIGMDEEMTTRQPKRNPRDRKYVQSVDLGPKKVDIEKFAQGVPKHRATSAMARSKALYKQGTANKILYRSTAFQKDWFLTVFIGTVIFAWAVCSRAQK